MLRHHRSVASCLTLIGTAMSVVQGCGKSGGRTSVAQQPDSLPVFIGDSLPFAYPPSLYISLVQDNVTLRLHLDEFGRPVPESTRVEEHALHPAFDSSALNGASKLVFRPAYRNGTAIPYTILFPIKFRVPEGPPMPGDPPRVAK
jgi:hypothetical protein